MGEAARGVRHLVSKRTAPRDSLAAALHGLLLSPEEEAMAYSMFTEMLGGPLEEIDAHGVRDLFSRYGSERGDLEFHLSGGMGQIIEQLAAGLRRPPRLNTPVRRIRSRPDQVEVVTDGRVWTADNVIVAVPPPIARGISFEMEGHARLDALLASFTAGDMIKTVLVFDEAFWRLRGLSGLVHFSDPAGLTVADASFDGGQPPRLVAFQGGPLARTWAALPQEVRQERLVGHLRRAFGAGMPEPREMAEGVWVDDPWSGGGYNATVRLGGDPDAVAKLAAWEGRVRFAGAEVDNRFWGFVEGAIHSGREAVARIADKAPAPVF